MSEKSDGFSDWRLNRADMFPCFDGLKEYFLILSLNVYVVLADFNSIHLQDYSRVLALNMMGNFVPYFFTV